MHQRRHENVSNCTSEMNHSNWLTYQYLSPNNYHETGKMNEIVCELKVE